MKRTDVAALAFLVLGFYFLIPAAFGLLAAATSPLFGSSVAFPDLFSVLVAILAPLSHLLAGLFLVLLARPLAARFFPSESAAAGVPAAPADRAPLVELTGALLAVLGVWVLVGSVPDLLMGLIRDMPASSFTLPEISAMEKVVEPAIRCLVGLVLLLASGPLARRVHRGLRADLAAAAPVSGAT